MPRLDIVDFTKKYKGELWNFFLDLDTWRTFHRHHPMPWQRVKFSASNRALVPRTRGIYAFTVELSPSLLPQHGYIMYIGETGDRSSANLYRRFGDYLREQTSQDKRPAVQIMLKNWERDLFFNFVPLPDRRFNLKKLQNELLNAIQPPVNEMDFKAEIKAARKAQFR